jgi:small subunit ribosomal protein S20
MPIIKSAKKRVKQATKAAARNAKVKRAMREAIKAFMQTIAEGKQDDIAKAQRAAVKAIDLAAKKKIIHKNKAARRKAQIAAATKAANVKPTKAAPKKPAAKAPAKKPAAKKTTAKK